MAKPTSLIDELQVAVAEQEVLVEESALPEIFLLASSKAEATSILPKAWLKSNPALSVPSNPGLPLSRTHYVPVLVLLCSSFSQLSFSFCAPDETECVDIKGCHTPESFSDSPPWSHQARVWSRAGRRPCLQHVCYCVAAGGSSPSCSEVRLGGGCCCCC